MRMSEISDLKVGIGLRRYRRGSGTALKLAVPYRTGDPEHHEHMVRHVERFPEHMVLGAFSHVKGCGCTPHPCS